MCGFPVQAVSRSPVDLGERVREFVVRHLREVRSFREELAEEPVGVLVAPPLPRCVRVDEIHRHAERRLDAFVTAELLAMVRRRRLERAVQEGAVHRIVSSDVSCKTENEGKLNEIRINSIKNVRAHMMLN